MVRVFFTKYRVEWLFLAPAMAGRQHRSILKWGRRYGWFRELPLLVYDHLKTTVDHAFSVEGRFIVFRARAEGGTARQRLFTGRDFKAEEF